VRLSDLLKAEVVDVNGETVGHVHDVRFVRDGPLVGDFGTAYQLQGLIVGRGSVGSRLGFDRKNVQGPWLLKALFRRVHASSRFVEWDTIRSIEEQKIRISVVKDRLPEVPDLPR
jgi:hypothetical protein